MSQYCNARMHFPCLYLIRLSRPGIGHGRLPICSTRTGTNFGGKLVTSRSDHTVPVPRLSALALQPPLFIVLRISVMLLLIQSCHIRTHRSQGYANSSKPSYSTPTFLKKCPVSSLALLSHYSLCSPPLMLALSTPIVLSSSVGML